MSGVEGIMIVSFLGIISVIFYVLARLVDRISGLFR